MPRFRVSDIHCNACIRSLTGAVQALDEHATLNADLAAKLVEVNTAAGDDAVAQAMREAGFTVEVA